MSFVNPLILTGFAKQEGIVEVDDVGQDLEAAAAALEELRAAAGRASLPLRRLVLECVPPLLATPPLTAGALSGGHCAQLLHGRPGRPPFHRR